MTGFIRRRLKLKGNETKSAVARPQARKLRELTPRTRGISLEQMTKELATYLRGWKSYFGFSETPSAALTWRLKPPAAPVVPGV